MDIINLVLWVQIIFNIGIIIIVLLQNKLNKLQTELNKRMVKWAMQQDEFNKEVAKRINKLEKKRK